MQKKRINTLACCLSAPLAGLLIMSSIMANGAQAQDENIIIKNRNASFYDNPISRTYTGKSPFQNQFAEPAPAPEPRPRPRPAPPVAPPPAPAPQPTYSESCAYLVNLVKKAPSMVALGQNFTYELNVTAQCDVADATVVDTIPEGASFVSSDPAATPEGSRLTWKFPTMNRGETKTIRVTVKAEREGELVNCATVSAIPRVCVSTMVGKPQLEIKKTGPATAQLGSEVTYTIVISNTGNTPANGVVVTDPVPEGFSHASGQREFTFNVGDLAPGQAKQMSLALKADKRGEICNTATANSSNAGKVAAEACTTIVQPGVSIEKTTQDKELLINRTATYQVVVSNTGDTTLTGVVVTDTAAPETAIVSAEGGTASGNTATWNVGQMKPGEKKNYTVKVMSKVPGRFCNTASVTTAEGLRDSSQACTEWIGVTGVLVEVVDDPDPIQIGETTTFNIRVTNQGSTRDIVGLDVKAIFEEELDAATPSTGGTVNGKNVAWPTVPRLAPKQSVTYTVVGKAVKAGDHRLEVQVTTQDRTTPITELESTTVY